MNYKIGFKNLVLVTIYLISMVFYSQGDEVLSCLRCYWRETKTNGTEEDSSIINGSNSNNSSISSNNNNNSSEVISDRKSEGSGHHHEEHDNKELEAQKLCKKGERSTGKIRLVGKCPKNTTYCFKASGSPATSNDHIILRGCAFDWMERKREGEGWRFVVEERARVYDNREKGEDEREVRHLGHTHKKGSDTIAIRVFEAWTYYCNTSYCNDAPDFEESPKKKKKGLFGIGSSAHRRCHCNHLTFKFLPIFLLLYFNQSFFHVFLIHNLRLILIS